MPEEALALRRLSVFRGGFTLEAAAHVALSTDERPADTGISILNLVAALCDKSLLAPTDAVGDVQRFAMLETVREFAHEQLSESDDLVRTTAAHAAYYRDWLEVIEPDFLGPHEERWIALYTAEVGNLHVALNWGIQHDADLAQRMGASLWAYWALQSPGEGLRWLNGAISAPGSSTARVRSRALRTAGAMAVLIGNYDVAASLATEALELALQASAPWLEGEARWILGLCDIFAGNFEQAEHHLTCAVALLDPAPTPTEITISAYVRSALGIVAFLQGYRAWGLELYDRAVSELRPAGGASVPIVVFTDYAGWLIMLERLPQARQLLHEALHLARRTPTSWLIGGILVCLALADAMEGHAASAAYKLGAVEGIRTSRGITVPVQYQQRVDRATVLSNALLEPSAFAEAYDHGRLNPGEIVAQLLSNSAAPLLSNASQQAARRLGLTRRECDVLPYVVAGMSDREIASRLFISHRTASAHVSRILQRLGASTRADAAVRAVRLGLA
jgi:DNA-binding CsgD family transcriptional regulator